MTCRRLIVIDLSSFIFRSYYAISPLTLPDGTNINAVYGVFTMLLKVMQDFQPSHLILALDSKVPNFRKTLYPEYKANRSAPPEDLRPQFALIDQLVALLNIPHIRMDGYEADDLIGSLVVQWRNHFEEIYISSSDKDLMQFVDDRVRMLDTKLGKLYSAADVKEKMGVWPHQIVDYLSLVGDSSDNIPGMKGVGAKGAAKLLAQYENLDGCIQARTIFGNRRIQDAFANHLEEALLSKKLIQIVTDLPLDLTHAQVQFDFQPPSPELLAFFDRLQFKTPLKKLQDYLATRRPHPTPTGPAAMIDLEPLRELATTEDPLTLFTHATLALYRHAPTELYLCANDTICQIQDLSIIKQLIENYHGTLVVADWKSLLVESNLDHSPTSPCQIFDLLLAFYVTDVNTVKDLPHVFEIYAPTVDQSSPAAMVGQFAAIKTRLEERIRVLNLEKIYYEIELPTLFILARMERAGILINKNYLQQLSADFKSTLIQIEQQIQEIANTPCNLKSPKQVSELLFEKLGLPVIRKTKTQNSTDSDVLEELVLLNLSPVPELILQYREVDKLLSTYSSVLPELAHPQTHRIHTHFGQFTTTTGRLSSDRPNLQNIPIRSANGLKIRKGLIATPGKLLFSADYSQMELRLLAHFSQDEALIAAFRQNIDVHAQTAAEVLGIPVSQVSTNQRSLAKAVNFGLMYGQSSFGLAATLKISRQEAKEFITRYFQRFSKVKSYLDGLKDFCAQHGYIETLFGRRRALPEIFSTNRNVRAFAERAAINMPIQGTAADIIKLAMISIERQLEETPLMATLLLQIHDELVFEVDEDDLERVQALVVQTMESIVSLNVPLRVETGFGVNLADLK